MKKVFLLFCILFTCLMFVSCGSDESGESEEFKNEEIKYINEDDLYFASGCDFTLIEKYFKENGNESNGEYLISGTKGLTAYSIQYTPQYKQLQIISSYSVNTNNMGIVYDYIYTGTIQIALNQSLAKAKYIGQYDHQGLQVNSGKMRYYTASFTFSDLKYITLTDVADYQNIKSSGKIISASDWNLAYKHFDNNAIGSKCYERIEGCLIVLDELFKSIDKSYKIAYKYIDPAKCKHVSVIDKGIQPTCLENGLTDGAHCKICNIVLVEKQNIQAQGHTSVVINGYSATCTENGLTDGEECSTCGTVITEQTVIVSSHNYVNRICTSCNSLQPSQGLTFTLSYLNGYGECYSVSGIGTCTDSLLVIPDTYNELPVRRISSNAFQGNNLIEKVVMTDSIIEIGSSAFFNCTKLNSITLSKSLESIGYSAFYESGIYNNSTNWKDGILYLDKYLINAKKDLTGKCVINEGTALIADSAFMNCQNISEIVLPDSVLYINKSAFSQCKSLVLVEMSHNILNIEANAFSGCSITDIYLPKTIKLIGYDAFPFTIKSVNYEGTVGDWDKIKIDTRFYCQIICSNGVI